ncbi:MAG: rhomboid family intramembrane serine protease [Actinomycetes bacterium]
MTVGNGGPGQYAQYYPYPAPLACAYHPDRLAGVRCQRCGNPICGECMVEAPVGHHCRRCVAEAMARSRQAEGPYGGRRVANSSLTSIALIVLNVLVWVGTSLTGASGSRLFSTFALTPASLCAIGNELWTGMDSAGCSLTGGTFLPGVLDGAWWQVITSAFTHANWIHLGFNMFVLWVLGPQLERILGRARFLALYLGSALTASAFVLWLAEPTTSTVGASGAVFGLMGALLVLATRARGDVRQILVWLGLNVVVTVVGAGAISWQGHLGGFVGGVALTLALVGLRKAGPPTQWLAVAGIVGLSLALMVARVMLA